MRQVWRSWGIPPLRDADVKDTITAVQKVMEHASR